MDMATGGDLFLVLLFTGVYGFLVLGVLVLGVVVLMGFHKKNKTEIRVIRKRLGLGENGKGGATS